MRRQLRTWRMIWLGAVLTASATGCGKSSGSAPGSGGTAGGAGVAGTAGGNPALGGDGGGAGMSGGIAGTSGGMSGASGMTGASGGVAGAVDPMAGTAGGGSAGVAGAAGANDCGSRDVIPPHLSAGTLEPDGTPPDTLYDGPAIVERSTERELVLSLEGGDGGGGAATLHVTLEGLTPMPLLTRGTKLWLAKNPLADPPFSFLVRPPVSVSVRDREDGTLLFGSASGDFSSAASPVGIGDITPVCTAPSPNTCLSGGTVTYSSVTVAGDTPVVVEDGTPGAITLGGEPYDVWVIAREEKAGGFSNCPDYVPVSGVALYVEAARLAELLPTLEVGPEPECGHGSDPDVSLYFGLYGVGIDTTHEGVVRYAGPDVNALDAYLFEIPGLVSLTDQPAMLSIQGAAVLMPEPAVGQELWLSFPGLHAHALRESEGGPVVLAQSWGSPGDAAAGELGALLGVEVTLAETCAYTPSIPLLETVFATEPQVRVQSGTTGTLVIGERTYRVWAWGQGSDTVTVYPAG